MTSTTPSPVEVVADPRQRRGGFAMISVIIAVVMIATGVMALAAANTTRMRYQSTSTARTVALNIARDYHEAVRARNPFQLNTESVTRVDAGGNPVANGEYTRELKVTVDKPNLVTVEVIVGYPRGNVPVRLLTSIYRGVKLSPRS